MATITEVGAAGQLALETMELNEIVQARDEVFREHAVRERCFPKWVKEGRLSVTDAEDRMRRQTWVLSILNNLLDMRKGML